MTRYLRKLSTRTPEGCSIPHTGVEPRATTKQGDLVMGCSTIFFRASSTRFSRSGSSWRSKFKDLEQEKSAEEKVAALESENAD